LLLAGYRTLAFQTGEVMRDIKSDLQERVDLVQKQINAEHAQFEKLIFQLKTEHNSRLEDLRVQLRAVNKLIDFSAWQHNVRAALLLAISGTEAAEVSANKALETALSR
jgi:CII-binding regulator of phage lambda lysogenization HflD